MKFVETDEGKQKDGYKYSTEHKPYSEVKIAFIVAHKRNNVVVLFGTLDV